jgi:hypothetical protein
VIKEPPKRGGHSQRWAALPEMMMMMMMIIIIIIIIMWNQQVQTERTIPNNRPDIVIRDNETGTCMLIDVAIPGHRNVIQKKLRRS